MSNNINKTLSKLGLSPSEIKIYLQLVKKGASYANKISRETKINRSNIYDALDRLVAKGLISLITKNKVKWFEARPPNALLTLVQEQEENLQETKKRLVKEIKDLSIEENKKLEATIFTGKKGLRMIFEEMLEVKKPISIIAAELQFKKLFGPYFDLWHKKRIQGNIAQRSIFPHAFKGKLQQKTYLQYKFVDDEFTNPTTTIIYGSNCVFVQWSQEPLAIKVQSKNIATSHLNYFNMVWKS